MLTPKITEKQGSNPARWIWPPAPLCLGMRISFYNVFFFAFLCNGLKATDDILLLEVCIKHNKINLIYST